MGVSPSSSGALDLLVRVLRPIRFRGKVRLLDKLVPRAEEQSAEIFGCRVTLDLRDHVQRWIYFGSYEPEETRWVKAWLRPGMSVVDVGANVGYYTSLASSCVGTRGKVFAVEPSPYAYARLCKMVADNALSNVVTLQAALGSVAGEGLLYLSDWGGHTPSMLPLGRHDGLKVPLKTLDGCLAEWSTERVDLLKIDVEGFEPQVLAGACSALRSGRIRAMICEFHDFWLRQAGGSAEELYHLIEAEGFSNAYTPPQLGRNTFNTCFFVYTKA